MKSNSSNPNATSSATKASNDLAPDKKTFVAANGAASDDDGLNAADSLTDDDIDVTVRVVRSIKTDAELGRRVEAYLREKGVATPQIDNGLSSEEKRTRIAKNFTEIMQALGLDLTDDSLRDSPKRVAQMYVDEVFYGLHYDTFPKCTTVENKMGYTSMVIERNVSVQSTCEHHFVIIDGLANVAYIPNKKVLGLSKINRIVEFFSKRPQIQERLTEQIYYALSYILGTEDIAVQLKAQHYCVKSRGVGDVNSDTVTSKLGGEFLSSSATRSEFMRLTTGTLD